MPLLKSTGYAKEYWNGIKFVEFDKNEYNATDDEAAFLLNCHGVYLPETPKVYKPEAETLPDETPPVAPKLKGKGGK